MTLHPIEIHELPRDTLFVRVSHPDGTVWAIPSSAVIECAARYYKREKWREDEPWKKQPMGKLLIGILLANSDAAYWAKCERWSEFSDVAKLLAGPGTIPPRDDKLWWFEEAGGSVEEMTTLIFDEQIEKHGRLLCVSEAAMKAMNLL